jgi:hypothetical protein
VELLELTVNAPAVIVPEVPSLTASAEDVPSYPLTVNITTCPDALIPELIAIPVPAPTCVLVIDTAPLLVSVAPIVSVVPDSVTPAAVIVFVRFTVPDDVKLNAPVNVSFADVLMFPAPVIVKLLIFDNVPPPIDIAVVPLLNTTLFNAPVAVEPITDSAPTALVPVRLTVFVFDVVVSDNVTSNVDAAIAPAPFIV